MFILFANNIISIRFIKFNNSIKNSSIITQPLLVPYVLNVNALESSFITENIPTFNAMGVEISEFGQNSFKISAIPVLFSQIDLSKFFNEILSDLETLKKCFSLRIPSNSYNFCFDSYTFSCP